MRQNRGEEKEMQEQSDGSEKYKSEVESGES